ncbi:MAG: phosphoethanolamine transferase, partial [Gammaproteobacteria bacterium]|nr:phosphoethanolamine transferase [Gammaproteobacteria bacterium]
YSRPTTPALQAHQAEYLRFDNVVSAFAQTSPSLRVALTEANVHNQAGYETSISLLEAAKKAGFKTFWISNQQPSRIPTTPIAANADSAHFISHDFKGVENHRYDGYLLPSVEKALADPAAHKVIFVHLMGSHLQYRNRYPEAFAVFKGKEGVKAYTDEVSSSELQYINEYDNSVLYTDFILGKLMGLLSQQKQIAALSFFADHGEEVFDSTDFKGHGPDSVTKNMVEIPFLLWRNAAYQQAFVQTERVLQNRLQAPFMLDDYFHFGLCFMHIQSNLTRPAQSWCAPEFEPLPRLVYGKDYDKEWP